MLSTFTPEQLLQGGAAGLLVLLTASIITSFVRGWMVPRGVVKQLYEAQEARVVKAEEREQSYREANQKLADAIQILSDQIRDSNEQGRTMIAILNSIQQAQQSRRTTGGR